MMQCFGGTGKQCFCMTAIWIQQFKIFSCVSSVNVVTMSKRMAGSDINVLCAEKKSRHEEQQLHKEVVENRNIELVKMNNETRGIHKMSMEGGVTESKNKSQSLPFSSYSDSGKAHTKELRCDSSSRPSQTLEDTCIAGGNNNIAVSLKGLETPLLNKGTGMEDTMSFSTKVRVKKVLHLSHGLAACVRAGLEVLSHGGVVAVPTDTIYGLACSAQNTSSIRKLYDIKNRKCKKPLAICLAEKQEIYKWCVVSVSDELLTDLLPGPVTLLFQRKAALNPLLNPHTQLVGVRIPDHDLIRELCRDNPLALTSANPSDAPSCVNIEEFSSLWPMLDLIFDGGSTSSRAGSTVVDLSESGTFHVIRKGSAFEDTMRILVRHGLFER